MKEEEDRKVVLLRAAYDLLRKAHKSTYVLSVLDATVHYDGADCDGSCLMEDIAIELDINKPKLDVSRFC